MEYNTFDDIIKVLKSDNNEQSQQAQSQEQEQAQTMVAENEPKWFDAEPNQSQDNAQANQIGVNATNSNNADSTNTGQQVVNDGRQVVNDGQQDLYGALNDRQSFAQYVGDNAKRITMYDDAENNPYSNYSDEELENDSKMIRFLASTAQPGTPARNRVDRYIEEVNKRNNTKQLAPAQKNKDGYYLYNPSSADEEENEFLNLNNEQLQKQAEETKKSLDAMSADSKDYADTYKRFEKILYAIDMRDYSNKNNEPMKRYNQQVKAYNDAMVNQRAKQNSEANTAAKGLQNWLNSHDVSKDINAEAYASTSWRNGAIDTANMSEQEAIVQAWNYVNGDTATADKINYVRGVMSNLEARKKGDKNAQTLVAKMLNEQQDTLQEYQKIRGSEKTASGKNKYIDDAEKQALLTFKQNAEAEEKANEEQELTDYDRATSSIFADDDDMSFARMRLAPQALTGVDYAKLAVNAWESIPENKRNAMILTIAEDRGDLTEQGINKVADEVSSKFMQDCFNSIKADIPDAMVGTIQNALSNSIVGTLTQGVLRSMNPNAGEVTYQSLIAEKQADWASKNTFGMITSTALQMVLDAPAFGAIGKGANIATKTIAKPILNRAVAGRWILPKQFSNSIYNTFAMTKSGQFALGVTQGAFLGAMFSPMQLATQSFATGQTFSVGDYLSASATGALHFGAMGVTPFISNGMSKWWGNKFSGTGKVSTIFNSAGQVAIHDLISPGINATLVTAIENVSDICSKGISPDLLTEWARTYGEFIGFHIGGKVAHITRGNLIKNLRSMYGHQTQLSRSVFTNSELKALRGSDAVKEIQRIIRENEQLDDATMNKIAKQHKLIIEDASIPEAVKMKLFAAIGNSAIATPTIADCRIENDGKHSTVSIYTADGKLFSQERYKSAKAAQNEKKRIDGYIKVNNINMLEGAYNQVWYSAINSDAIDSMSKSLGEDANTIVERLDTITRKKQNGERLSEDDNAFVKSFGEFFNDAQKRNENAETDRILNASDVKDAFKKLGKDVDAILSKMPWQWSEAEAEVIDRYTRRMQSDVDRFNSEIKSNNEKKEIANELDDISEQSYNTTDAESMNALAIELNIATADAEKEFGGATLQEIFDNPVEAIQRINNSKDYTYTQKEKLNELCRLQVRMNAMVRRVNNDINSELEQSRQAIEQVTNKQTDEVIEVELTPKSGVKEGTKVYVINGQLNTYGEGVVDYDKSDKSIAIYIDGEGKKMVSPSQIVRVISRQSAEEALNAQAQEIVSRHRAEADSKFNATIPAQVGYKFPVLLRGEEKELEIVEQRDKNGNPIPPKDGNVFVNDNGNVIEMPIDSLTNMANELKARRIAEERAKRYPAQEVKEAEKTDTAVNEQEPEPEQKAQEPSPKEMEIEPKEKAPEKKEEAPKQEPKEQESKPEPKVNEPEQKDEASSPKYERGEAVLDIDGEDKIGYINGKKGELYEYYVQGEDNFRYATEKELDSIVKEYTPDKREDVLDKDIIDALEQLTEQKENDSIEEQSTEQKQEELNEPMPKLQNGEEDWMSVTPERAHQYIFGESGLSASEGKEFISAKTQEANKALINAKSSKIPKVGTSIKKYTDALAKRNERINEAKRILEYWQKVQSIQNKIQREDNERRAKEDALLHDKAVADAQAEYEARKQAEAERKAVGNENPMPAITDKWNNATKVDGHRDEIILPDGTSLKGHYVLHESGASSPSHNPETWKKTEGFPMDANDNSVNDRDYERDHDAQEHTQRIAQQYDQRALQSVPVVSNDGVVLSGNGRTMAGELAARDNTDGAYINYLKEYAPKFGFTAEQVEAMQHPRVSFVPDEAMPYTAETFAKFNQQEMKSQNKPEQAVKLGKTVSDDIFTRIVRIINGYDTLGEFYNDAEASLGAVYDLHNAGVFPQAQLAEMVDGVRGQEKLSAVGREFLENMLIGKAFDGDPEVVRMLTAEPAMRQTVITALGEIVDNISLGGDWSLQRELAEAVNLCFDARKGGAKYGEIVSTYARQGVLFADPDKLQTVADFNNATMLMLADAMNDKRVTLLKTTLQLYNNNARESAAGQADLFAGGIKSREDILRDVITFINENYGKQKEIEAARAAAVERRKAESVQQNGDAKAGNGESEKYQLADEQGKDIQQMSKEQEADAINPDVEEKQRVQELTEEEKSAMKAIASHLGSELIFEDNAPYNGVYRTIDEETKKPTIRISRRATNPLDAVFGHEILHRLRKVSSDAYNEMLTAVRVIIGDDAFYNEAYSIKRLYAENKENPVAISDKAAGEEVVANFVGSLIHDKAHLSKLVYKLSHPVLSSIRDAFSEFLNYFRRGGLSYDAAMAKGALRMIDRAFANAANSENPNSKSPVTKFQIIGEKGAEALDKAQEATIRMDNLSVAREMEKAGKDAKTIRLATGWERGADGKWRYEIMDGKFYENWENKIKWDPDLPDIYYNYRLYQSYPEFRNISIISYDRPDGTLGYVDFSSDWHIIFLNERYGYFEDTVLHELQHIIQYKEGFSMGSSVENLQKDFDNAKTEALARLWMHAMQEKADEIGNKRADEVQKELIKEFDKDDLSDKFPDWLRDIGVKYFERGYADKSKDDIIKRYGFDVSLDQNFDAVEEYYKIAGEVESRNVEARMNMSEQERRETLLADTEDVSRKDQIFLFNNLGESQMGTDYNAPRVEDDAKYQITGESNSADKSLIGVHNITEDKLIKAIKQGGFANPSLAVIDTKNGMHSDYGKISLIPKSSLIDSKTGKNAGTFAGDAWTPTYPHVEKQMSENGVSMFYKDIHKVSNNDSINNELSSVWRNYMDGSDPDKLSYWFLKERGIEPENVYINSGYTEEQRNKFAKLTDNGSKRFEDMTEEQRNGIISLMAEKDGVSIGEKLEKYQHVMEVNKRVLNGGKVSPIRKASLQRQINEIEQYGVTLSAVSDFMYGMKRALKTDGKLDVNNTLKSSHDKVVSSGLQEEFDKWLIEKEEKYGVQEMLFDGFTREGNRKYIPNTLENASKMMNREEEKNSGGQSGFGPTRAILLEKMKSLDDIRKNKGKLKGVDEYTDQRYQEASDEMLQVLKVLSDMQKISDNPFSNIDYANLRLQDALTHKDPIEWLNKEYGYEIDKNGDFAKGLTDLIENLKNLPVKYFETKFNRPVSLGEFAIAIVPDGTSKYIVDALKKSGIDVRMYDGTEEGRTSATMDAILDRDDIRFQLRGTPEQKFSDTDSQSKSREAQSMSRRMNVPIRVVDDSEYIFHDNIAEENRRKNSKGYYDSTTGEVVVVAPNNKTAGDVVNTVFHETVAHKGLRDIAGEDYHERFVNMAYGSMSDAMRSRINSNAYDAIMDGKYDDWTEAKNSEISKVLNNLSQKDFDEFTEDEIALWKRLREHTMNVIEESSGIADIRGYASLNDTELRYMLWKDNNNFNSSVERDAIDTAMSIEYGLDNDTRYSLNLKPTYKSNRDAVSSIRDEQLPIEDRIAIVKMKLADKQKQSMAIRNDAVKKVTESLDSINRAISAQRLHDKLTASRIVALASEMISGNFLNNMGKNDIKTLLRTTRDAVDTNDFESQLNRLFDVLINNMDKDNESLFDSLISTKAKKVDKRGVEVQGTLDAEGQQMLQALNIAYKQSKDKIEQMITEAQNYISEEENEVLKKDASNKLSGYILALQYARDIAPTYAEEEDLKTQIKILSQETGDAKKNAKAAIKAIKGAIRKLKIQRIEAYRNLIGQLSKEFGESVGKAKEFKEMEKQRVQEIHHNANSDMQGRSHASWVEQNETAVAKVVNNSAFRILFSPLATFDQMMRMFGRKSANGEGYLWNRYVRGWVECREKELSGFKEKMKILDEKVKELFPGRKGPNSITDMIKWSENLPKSTVEYWNGERFETRKLSQGNLMYIYMASKMIDGKMKLAKMGITDEDVARIKQSLDPKIIQMADWIQEELLPKARVEYNETHKRLFGAPMASIENYFPLKILKTALEQKEEDLDVDNTGAISETTNAFKRRTVNVKPLDIVGTNALNLVVSHLSEMEHINAFGEWNRDLNTLRTYNRFRNQVMNMKSVYGSGEVLWREFNKLCQIAAGTYKPQSAIGGTDSYAVNIAKGYTASRIAFRAFTAAKQLASIIAYLPDVSVSAIAKSAATAYSSFQWSMDNLPLFKERWKTRIAGDPRLLKTEKDWSLWSSKAMELSSKYGMLPNAFVDAVTVAIGAKAIYDTRYKKYFKQYKKSGATDDDAKAMADKKAKQDATIMYNSTQQSNEAIFLSPIQVDRTWHSVMMSIFRNSPFSYTRQTYDAMRNLKRSIFDRGYRKESIEFMTKQLMREQGLELAGVTEEQYNIFRDIAKKNYNSEIRRGLLRLATFGFACSFLWELYSKLPQLTISDDDEQNKEIFRYATTKALFGFNDGLYGGDVQSTALQAFFFGGGTDDALSTIKNSFNKSMPFTQSITDIAKKLCGERQAEGLSDLISLAVATGTGVDVKTIGDMVYAVMDACGDDIELSKEAMIFIMRVTNTPQSQIDQIYFEEVGMTGKEASKLTPEQLAKRYAEYKVKRGTMLIPSGFVSQKLYDSREQYAYQQIKERYSKRENPDIVEKYMELDKRIDEIGKQKTDALNEVSEGKFDDGIEKLSKFAQSRDYQMYKEFGQFRREFNKLVNFYMKSKSPKEAEYILNAIAGIRKDIATAYNMHNQGNEEMKYNYLQDAKDKFMDFYDEYAQMRPDIVEKSERANAARNALR